MNIEEIKDKIKDLIKDCDDILANCNNENDRIYYEGKAVGLGGALLLIEKLK